MFPDYFNIQILSSWKIWQILVLGFVRESLTWVVGLIPKVWSFSGLNWVEDVIEIKWSLHSGRARIPTFPDFFLAADAHPLVSLSYSPWVLVVPLDVYSSVLCHRLIRDTTPYSGALTLHNSLALIPHPAESSHFSRFKFDLSLCNSVRSPCFSQTPAFCTIIRKLSPGRVRWSWGSSFISLVSRTAVLCWLLSNA